VSLPDRLPLPSPGFRPKILNRRNVSQAGIDRRWSSHRTGR
jgi:hypothetical protein